MAFADKNILITPNRGSSTEVPTIAFVGADVSSNVTIDAKMYSTNVLEFSGSPGVLFSISAASSGTVTHHVAAVFNSTLTSTSTIQGTRLISTISTGTAPLTVSSTTTVSNLSADLLDGQDGSYYLAWGNLTGVPSPTFTVTLTGNVTGSGVGTLTSLGNGTASFATTIASDVVSNTMLRNSAALSVIGRSANSTGDPADIAAGSDGHVLRRAGTTLGFGQVATQGIADLAVTRAKIEDEAISTAQIEDAAVTTAKIADNAVTGAKFANYSITSNKLADASVNSDKLDTSDTYAWYGPNIYFGFVKYNNTVDISGVATFNNSSIKLGTAVTVTTDNGSGWWFNLYSAAKFTGLLLFPAVPSVTVTANDGTGNFSTLALSAAGLNMSFGGTADWAVNSVIGKLNETLVAQGNDTPPKFVHMCPPIRFDWTDFQGTATQSWDPFVGAAIGSGTVTIAPAWARQEGTAGWIVLQSAAAANSGYRLTSSADRMVGSADLYFRAILAVADDMTNKAIEFGFNDSLTSAESVDGAYFRLTAGSLVCTPKTASNSTRSSGSTFTLTANVYYVFEIYWNSTSSVNFKISSLDETTVHLDTTITTNIPTGTSRVFGSGIVATTSGTAIDDLVVVDYAGVGFKNKR